LANTLKREFIEKWEISQRVENMIPSKTSLGTTPFPSKPGEEIYQGYAFLSEDFNTM